MIDLFRYRPLERINDVTIITIKREGLNRKNYINFLLDLAPITSQCTKIVFDLSRLFFLDSRGLAALMWCMGVLRKKGRKLMLCGVTEPVEKVLNVTLLQHMFGVFETREEAIEAIQGIESAHQQALATAATDDFAAGVF